MSTMQKDTHGNRSLPLVSIVIPAYNSSQYLPECIESCLAQTYSNLEIVVVDDGSTDNTREVLQPYRDRISYHYQENTGLAGARNAGHEFALGAYVAWLDADDIAHRERIRLQASYLRKHPSTVLTCTNFTAFDETGKEYSEYASVYYSQLADNGGIGGLLTAGEADEDLPNIYSGAGRHILIWGNFIHPPTVMIRKEACLKAGPLKNNIPTQEDWEYFFRISQYGAIAWLDSPLLLYRLHSQQMSSTANAVKNATGIVRVFEDMIDAEQEYARRHKNKVRKMLGKFCSGAVYTLIEAGDKIGAAGYLKKSFLCNPVSWRNYKLLTKLVLS